MVIWRIAVMYAWHVKLGTLHMKLSPVQLRLDVWILPILILVSVNYTEYEFVTHLLIYLVDEAAPDLTESGDQVVETILEKKVTRKAVYYKVIHYAFRSALLMSFL